MKRLRGITLMAGLAASSACAQPAPPLEFTARGALYSPRLDGDRLTFCVGDRKTTIDLSSPGGTPPAETKCEAPRQADPACASVSLGIDVRTPIGMDNDIVDLPGGSVPLVGHVVDCAGAPGAVAVATSSAVLVIDPTNAKVETISTRGADHVAISDGWVAWSRGPKVFVLRRGSH